MRRLSVLFGLTMLLLTGMALGATTGSAPRISKEEALKLLGAQKTVFVDARTESSWRGSDRKIKGAVRIDKWDLEMWSSSYPSDTTFIVY